MIELGIGFAVGMVAGFGWGRASIATLAARLTIDLEVARQTGKPPDASVPVVGDVARTVRSLFSHAVKPTAAGVEDRRAVEEVVERGAGVLLADARAAGRTLSQEEARDMARQMIAEVGLT